MKKLFLLVLIVSLMFSMVVSCNEKTDPIQQSEEQEQVIDNQNQQIEDTQFNAETSTPVVTSEQPEIPSNTSISDSSQPYNPQFKGKIIFTETRDYEKRIILVKLSYPPESITRYYYLNGGSLERGGFAPLIITEDTSIHCEGGFEDDRGANVRIVADFKVKIPRNWNIPNAEQEITGTIEYNDGIYTGAIKNGIENGWGTYLGNDGSMYVGEWKDGNRDGYGEMKYVNYLGNENVRAPYNIDYYSGIYTGYWVNDKRNGRGTYHWYNGDYYEGNWQNDQRSGYGKITWGSGQTYEGDWKDGARTGQGIWMCENGDCKYYGGWKNGLMDGLGTFIDSEGTNTGYYDNGSYLRTPRK